MESITIEKRPRIQSCNVFISTRNPIESHKMKLSLKNNLIGLKLFNNLFDIDLESLIIIPESLSSLNVSDKYVSFRLQSSPVDSTVGTFSTEVIDSQKIEREIVTEKSDIQLPPKNTQLSLVCSCCKNILSKSDIIFKRVLPLPSDDCDPSQWFCCSHTGDDFNITTLLQPRDNDFFYGSHYSILSRNIFLDKYKIFGEDIVCNRCLTVLGSCHLENHGDAIKFWNSSLQFTLKSSPSVYCNETNPWIDFRAAFLHCINDDIFNTEINFLAVEQNRQYLLIIKPVEKNLCLLTESLTSKLTKITLVKKFVTKVLYRYEKLQCPVKNNSDVRICRISVKSMIAGIDNLIISSRRIPPIYRKVEVNYHVGYIQ
ncbi:uncharacterized protein [Fopius arisanus]|uniref:HECT-type E3 ubiquitin transferase E3D n=1 Tax=Fopius arisanus TaxID=64838 RepID=A0A9R1TU93_9HYME|nr:PREDICTED: uncharacterized protein LOC105263772 [Fopius arisanus]